MPLEEYTIDITGGKETQNNAKMTIHNKYHRVVGQNRIKRVACKSIRGQRNRMLLLWKKKKRTIRRFKLKT